MNFNSMLASAFLVSLLSLFACTEDDNTNSVQGTARFELTDAPIDDADVSAVFVTVADVKIDGQSIEGFNKTTVDVLSLQNGATELLGTAQLEAGSYNNVSLVLDFESDVNGTAPGCYVEEAGGNVKHKLESASNELTLAANVVVEANQQATFVMDFDLRKTIKREDNQGGNYDFVSRSEMESGIRVVSKTETGIIRGSCRDNTSNSDKIVVYAYKAGTYNRSSEVSGQGASSIEFANAASSAQVDANGNFQLHFLEEGDYEVVFCSYEENASGEMELQGTLLLDLAGSLNLSAISVGAQSTVDVDVSVTGILEL